MASPLSPSTPDIVQLSKLDTQFLLDPKRTQHIKYVFENERSRKKVYKEESWKKEKVLGRGGFGVVTLEQCIQGDSDGKFRAVKKIRKLDNYQRELEAIALFSHEKYAHCFVKSFGWFDNEHNIYIAMEYFPYGDLQKHLQSPLSETEGQSIVSQVLEGLGYMHRHGFAHRDLKPANILVVSKQPEWWVKIADFGISKRAIEKVTALHTSAGTTIFAAPEVRLGSQSSAEINSYTNSVDIWSLGVIAFLILTGETLFEDLRRISQYVAGTFPFPEDTLLARNITKEASVFIHNLLAVKPEDRPTAEDCLQSLWLVSSKESITLQPERISYVSKPWDTRSSYMNFDASANWDTQNQASSSQQRREGDNLPAKRDVMVTFQQRKNTLNRTDVPQRSEERLYDDRQSDQELPSKKPQGREHLDEPTLRPAESQQRIPNGLPVRRILEEGIHNDRESDGEVPSRKSQGGEGLDEPTLRPAENCQRSSSASTPATLLNPWRHAMVTNSKILQEREELDEPTLRPAESRQRSSSGSTPATMVDPSRDFIRMANPANTSVPSPIQSIPEQYSHLSQESAAQPVGLPIAKQRKTKLYGKKVLFKSELKSAWWVSPLALSPDNKLVAFGVDEGLVRLWDITKNQSRMLEGYPGRACSVAFSPHSNFLAVGFPNLTIQVWSPAVDLLRYTLQDNSKMVSLPQKTRENSERDIIKSITFSPNGRLLASGSDDRKIRLWDPVTGELLRIIEGHSDSISSLTFSSDSKMLASCCYSEIWLWDPTMGKILQKMDARRGMIPTLTSLAFSPNRTLLVSTSNGLRLWDPVTGKLLATLRYGGHPSCVAVSPDNQLIAAGSSIDGEIYLWHTRTGELLQVLKGHSRQVHTVIFSTDNKLLVSGSHDNTVQLWDIDEFWKDSNEGKASKLLRRFRNKLGRRTYLDESDDATYY